MVFKYKSVTETGQIVEGFLEANSESDAISMIKSKDHMPLLVEKDIEADAKIELFAPKVKKKDLAVLCRQFYTMLDAGLGIVKCLDILAIQTENKTLRKAIVSINEDVQKGLVLSEAMKKHKKIFPGILTSMVEAGEVSGNLDTIMERMALHFEKENRLENKIKSSLIYPMILIVVSIAVVVFMLVAVLPTFVGMFEGSDSPLPGPTKILISLSESLKMHWYIYGIVLVVFITGITVYKQTKEGKRFYDNLKIKLPFIKVTSSKIITSRFTRTLSTLMSSGIPLIQSMEVVERVVDNVVVEERIKEGIDNIRKGVPLSKSIKDVGIFPPMVDSMIKIGEESGALDDILYKTADFYDEEVETSLQRLTTIIEPLLIVGMALVIGFIVIAMAMPMFDVVNTI